MADRGSTQGEVVEAIRTGEQVPVQYGRTAFRKNFIFRDSWKGKFYGIKQVKPVLVEEIDRLVIVTVCVYYFGEGQA